MSILKKTIDKKRVENMDVDNELNKVVEDFQKMYKQIDTNDDLIKLISLAYKEGKDIDSFASINELKQNDYQNYIKKIFKARELMCNEQQLCINFKTLMVEKFGYEFAVDDYFFKNMIISIDKCEKGRDRLLAEFFEKTEVLNAMINKGN